MDYTIIEEPKYRDKVIVIIEGVNTDGDYFSMEELFSKKDFDSHVSSELLEILIGYYRESETLDTLSTKTFDIESSELSDCKDISGYEVMYFDTNGVCYPIAMNY